MVDFDLLKKLIEMVKNEDISGITIEDKGTKYEIRRERGSVVHVPPSTKNMTRQKTEDQEEDLLAITSPIT